MLNGKISMLNMAFKFHKVNLQQGRRVKSAAFQVVEEFNGLVVSKGKAYEWVNWGKVSWRISGSPLLDKITFIDGFIY